MTSGRLPLVSSLMVRPRERTLRMKRGRSSWMVGSPPVQDVEYVRLGDQLLLWPPLLQKRSVVAIGASPVTALSENDGCDVAGEV